MEAILGILQLLMFQISISQNFGLVCRGADYFWSAEKAEKDRIVNLVVHTLHDLGLDLVSDS